MLFKPIEIAFDQHRISFIKNSKGDIVMRVIDPSIASEYLIDYLDDTQMKIWIGYYFQILQQQ